MRAIAKRSDSVWLVTEEDGVGRPENARVLDLEQLKLFPPYSTQSILDRGDWKPVQEQPDLDSMMKNIDVIDGKVRDPHAEIS